MKVLLVQAYLGTKELPVFPLGLSMIATVLKGHDVRIYDPNVSEDPYCGLKGVLEGFQPDVVGISLRNIDNQRRRRFSYYFKTLGPTLSIIRKIRPSACLLTGGTAFSLFGRKIMERYPEVDFGIYLEGEESVPELLDNLNTPERVKGIYYWKDGKVLCSGPRPLPDFASLPIPRKDLVDLKKYSFYQEGIGIQTKRGCAYRCCYCTYPLLSGNRLRLRRSEHIVDEIEDLVERGVNSFMFADAIFTVPLSHATEICYEIIRRKLKIIWSAWAEPRLITKEFMLLARDAGCTLIVYSPDALSDESLRVMEKGITEDDVKKVYKLAKDIKSIRVEFGLFLSPPGETLKGLFKTLAFFIKGNIGLRMRRRGGVGLHWIRIEPDTRMYNIAISEGVITKETELLPEPEKVRLEELFYVHPPLKGYDKIIRIMFTVLDFLKRILDRLRGRDGR